MTTAKRTPSPKSLANLAAGRWKPGQSGNPHGRPIGAACALSKVFYAAVAKDFAAHGATVLAKLRTEHPIEYATMVADLARLSALPVPTGGEAVPDDDHTRPAELDATLAALEAGVPH